MADKNYLHTAYANSADGTDRFTTVYPNLNLLDGTKDFTGSWWYSEGWENDGTYKGLTVKKKTAQWGGISKPFIAPKTGVYTFSAYVKSSGDSANITRIVNLNGVFSDEKVPNKWLGNNFDWLRDSFTVTLKAKDTIYAGYNITGSGSDSILWTAGHKWEEGSTATPYMPSASEVTTADWPKFVGTYVDTNPVSSTVSSKYDWDEMKYRVYLDGVPVGGSKLLSFDLENLKAGTSYNVQVSQINGNVESDKSESVAFKTTLTK
ncbi:MAG: fibronectin type III domain-containing protein [Lactococcus cremoris]|uniref:fibronectin type III domain-containing protein n=1 Tax=Lactococcus lactis subsp. cremoris TaxID=1359 RepID=UPI0025A28EF3|nr:fibronectin type III domain-containing protein [Lactococcus cremoris]MDM7654654.1 fibronectin type III domain-containing protein [Lactococcus cremoris]